MTTTNKLTLDLNDLSEGGVQLGTFKEKLATFDVSPYKGQHVQIKGCAPTWAHLMVAGKLFPVVSALDFLLDDGKGGKTIEIFPKS